MNTKPKKIAVYGGAFNPPHIGHAIAVETIMRLFPADEIWIMPSGERPDKKIGVSGKERLAMAALMFKELFPQPRIPIKTVDIEVRRPNLTTTYDTKLELERLYPGRDFYFAIGSDLVRDIRTHWVKGKELYRSSRFIVIHRSNFPFPSLTAKNIFLLDEEGIWPRLSSTFIRKLIKQRHSGIPYLSKGVARYIAKKRLYR